MRQVLLQIGPQLGEVIQKRLGLLRSLEGLDVRRRAALKDTSLPEDARFDYQRQQREMHGIPSAQQCRINMERLKQRLAKSLAHAQAGQADPVDPQTVDAFKLAMQQWQLFLDWHALAGQAVKAGAQQAAGEPLMAVLARLNIPCTELFGWTYYMLGLDAVQANLAARMQRQKEEFKALNDPQAEDPSADTAAYLAAVRQEIDAVEPIAVEAFWSAYELAAQWWVADKVDEKARPCLRAFLRWGLACSAPGTIDPDIAGNILRDCATPIEPWTDATDSTDVLYADEYLWHVGHGAVTPSFDEDLELNRRNSPEWNADKAHRRIIHTRIFERTLVRTATELTGRVLALRRRLSSLEGQSEREKSKRTHSKAKLGKLREKLLECRAESGRLERILEKIKTEMIPRQREMREQAKAKLKSVAASLTRKGLITREVAGIRKTCKLVCKLAEPLLQRSLRDNYRPADRVVNLRRQVVGMLHMLEENDPTVFKIPLMPATKRSQTLYLRFSPTVLLTPAMGFRAYCWNGRAGSETGKLVLPGYCPRSGLLDQMLVDVLADFRWDSSKAAAGVDAMTSDTLVAAYTSVRWSYRKRGKDIRSKAAIHNEENDKENWRRHYTLYMASAADGGKRLFHKCKEVYDVVVRYMDLPDGVERLRA